MRKVLFLTSIAFIITCGHVIYATITSNSIKNDVSSIAKSSYGKYAKYSHPVKDSSEKIDRKRFFDKCAQEKEFIKLTKGQAKENINVFFDYWEKSNYTDKRWIANILANVYRETQGTMRSVREGNCLTNEGAIKAVGKLVSKRNEIRKKNGKSLMDDYSKPDSNGNSYYGRGFVQLTHKYNYEKIGEKIGVGNLLVVHPDSALTLNISLKILMEGSVKGWFTHNKKTRKPNKLSTFFNAETEDWVLARNIINPSTTLARKKITAEIAKKFYGYLR